MASTPSTTIVLVTGANQGIGYEIVKKLGTEHSDYHIILSGRRKDAVDEAVAKLKPLGFSLEGLVMDVASDESITEAAKYVSEKHGRLDVLINNAGVSVDVGPHPRKVWQDVFNVNVFGVVQVTDTFMPLLEKSQQTKRIVMISSSVGSLERKTDKNGFVRNIDYRVYTPTKSALNMVTLHYVARFDNDPTWKINLCCPGWCATNINDFQGMEDPKFGAINACRLATLGPDGETGTYTDRNGPIPW
ncbi:hypothetical protein B0T17DRAFT_335899 [Bombardia bombarda]|uniref:Carbonyl reductase n=1 Tax=Bombardia bombarda TaxID=252184 RepID=A0AA40BYN7_9PEZI|nr:hypothetical protein B0T17DRAFT_335899 [Bombardia bombarda]